MMRAVRSQTVNDMLKWLKRNEEENKVEVKFFATTYEIKSFIHYILCVIMKKCN